MEFYQTITNHYDYIFPLNRIQVAFVKSVVAAGKILDVGCATGSLALALANEGFEVSAIDLDEGMVAYARQKPNPSQVEFRIGDMLSIPGMYTHRSFDGITCFGNTIVHLSGCRPIGEFFRSANLLLKSGGKLMLQVLNYDSIVSDKIESLPLIENETIRFERYYEYLPGGMIRFITALTVKGSHERINNSVDLYPVTREEMENLLHENGFSQVEFYGGFNKGLLERSSLPLVAIATKP